MPTTDIVFELCRYDEIVKNTAVINLNTFSYVSHIHVPEEFNSGKVLYQIKELNSDRSELDLNDTTSRICCKPWIDVLSDALNKSIGQHVYKVSFVDTKMNDSSDLYFSYIVQSDSPERPFDYMEKMRSVSK